MRAMLQDSNIDFANLIEFDDFSNLTSIPDAWAWLQTTCGRDRVALLYNASRWRIASLGGAGQVGCMISEDRPFIVQAFERIDIATKGSFDALDSVVVIGAHFPHPSRFNESLSDDLVLPLRLALQSVIEASATSEVVLIADTNEFTSTSSDLIKSYLELPGNITMSTSLEQTCCFDNGFPTWDAYDRIIANFGSGMETVVLMDSPLPLWAQQVNPVTQKKGAFHKPIKGILKIAEGHTGPAVTTSSTSSTSATTTTTMSTTSIKAVASTTIVSSFPTSAASPNEMYYLMVVAAVACVVLVGLVVKCARARKQPSARDLEACKDDS